MDKVFIIIENPSDYDSIPEVIGFATTKEEADKICHTLSYFYQELEKFYKGMNEKLQPLRDSALDLEDLIEIPKWASGLAATSITDDMRAFRDGLIAKNNLIKERNGEKFKARTEEIVKAVAEIVGGLDDSEELNKYIRSRINDYGNMEGGFLYPYTNEEIKKLS